MPALAAPDSTTEPDVRVPESSTLSAAPVAATPPPPPTPDPAYAEELLAAARQKKLWDDRYWRLLLHYRQGLTGTFSESGWDGFFYSPRGRRDPQSELEATLRAFVTSAYAADPEEAAACRFPARFAWLDAQLGFDDTRLPPVRCPRYDHWREALDVKSASIVFASSYLNSPSSMYGHTFLLLRSHDSQDALLDTSINFAAEVTSQRGLMYVVFGVMGLFPGTFSATPYYEKVQRYNNVESRDLWEYRLNLDAPAVDRLMQHLWELDKVRFPYYFFNRNCSYQLLPLLEVADPGLHLTDRWPLYVIPADTVRAILKQPGLVTETRYRPAHVVQMAANRLRLSPEERGLLKALVKPERADTTFARIEGLSPESQARVLDSASEYLEYKLDYRRRPNEALVDLQRRVHVHRGRLTVVSLPPATPAGSPPEAGHGSKRLSFAYGSAAQPFEALHVRLSLHDLLDRSAGYHGSSTLEMGNLELRFHNRARKMNLERFDLLRIVSLSPRDGWTKPVSWKMSLGLETANELGQDPWDSLYARFNMGFGAAFETRVLGRELFYGMVEFDAGAGSVFASDTRWGGGPRGGVVLAPTSWWRIQAEASYLDYALGDRRENRRLLVEQSLSPFKNAAVRVRWERRGDQTERSVSLQKYF